MSKSRKSPQAQRAVRKPVKSAAIRGRAARPATPGIEVVRYAALAVICIAIWCTVYDRWSADAWNVPIEYGVQQPDRSDVVADLAGFKAARDGHYWPMMFHNEPHLGAPYTGNWNDYPSPEDFMIWGTGILASIVGVFAAANFLVMLLQTLAALAFYYAARRFKCDWSWSFAGALFFGLAPFGFAHSLHHFSVAAYWHMALAVLVCFWLANGRGLRIGARDYWIAIAVAVVTGCQNVYYTSMFIQMVGIALVIQWFRHGWRAGIPAFSIGCAAFATFMAVSVRTVIYSLAHGHNPTAVVRNYGQMEFYGLKLVDWFMPYPTHKIHALAAIGKSFYALTILPAEVPPACYFGLVGLAAFLWMAACTVRNAIGRDRKRIPFESVLTLWIFFYATVGGINGLLGVAGFELFRSTTRYSIVILCLSLMFAVRRLSLISKRWPSPWPVVAPVAIALIGLWEFVPPTAGEDVGVTKTIVDSDREFAETMETSMPKGGMVFQLPVMDYPESPIAGVPAYDHLRPYLYTRDLRYSFGSDKGRVETAWQRVIVGMPPAEQIAALESYGFSGIYVNRGGYPDKGEALLEKYKAAGRTEVIESPLRDLCCVVLKPSPNPVLPPPGPLFTTGWYAEQDSASGNQRDRLANSSHATLVLTNPDSAPVDKYANFYLATIGARTVTVEGAGAIESWHVDQQHPAKVANLHLTLAPGENRIVFSTDTPPTQQQMGPIAFDVVNFVLTDAPMAEK